MYEMHIVGGCIIEKEGKILLAQEAKNAVPGIKGKWNLPTGRVDHKEDMIHCAMREGFEETGLELEPEYLVGIYQGFLEFEKSDRQINVVKFVFKANQIGGELKTTDEVADLKYFSQDEVNEMNKNNQLRTYSVKRAIDDYFAGKRLPFDTLTIIRE